jgi:hypothetical protein
MLTVANSTFLVEGNFRRKHSITTLAAVALPQVAAVLFSSGTLVMMSNITIRCLDIPSASSSLFDIRSVVYGCAVSVALVALRQSSAPGEALINLSHAGNASVSDTALTSTISSSTDNVVEIPHTSVRAPWIVHSAAGEIAFRARTGIVVQCSYVGTTPMSRGHLDARLAANVVVADCEATKRSSLAADQQIYLSPLGDNGGEGHCWGSLSDSQSATNSDKVPSVLLTTIRVRNTDCLD